MSPQSYAKRTGQFASAADLPAPRTTMMVPSHACPACGRAPLPAAATTTQQLARYDENGDCVSIFTVSCETQWRVRECFKIAFCDFLYCVGENLCEDGHFKRKSKSEGESGSESRRENVGLGEILRSCGEVFVCSLVKCLPVAICGPRGEPVCPPPCPTLECDFAVEEIA